MTALLDREFNHSRKCLEVPIREKLDSRNIWRIQYTPMCISCNSEKITVDMSLLLQNSPYFIVMDS